jgi:hypothetical protein
MKKPRSHGEHGEKIRSYLTPYPLCLRGEICIHWKGEYGN